MRRACLFLFAVLVQLVQQPVSCADAESEVAKIALLTNKLNELLSLTNDKRHFKTLAKEVRETCAAISVARSGGRPQEPDEELVKFFKKRKIAIAYFGLTRSLSSIICNLYIRLYEPFAAVGLEVHSYLHTYDLVRLNPSRRNPEERARDQLLNPHEHRLLPLRQVSVTNQTEFRQQLNISDFVPPTNKKKFYDNEIVLLNLVSQYNSLELVTDLWTQSGTTYDAVLYVRPDMAWLSNFPLDRLKELIETHEGEGNPDAFIAMGWMQSRGINDRFGVGTPRVMAHFGRRMEAAKAEIRKSDRPLQAEGYLRHHMRLFSNATAEGPLMLEGILVPIIRVRHSCPSPSRIVDALPAGWQSGDFIYRKGCMLAHQDCEAFPFLEGQVEDEVFLPRFDPNRPKRHPMGRQHYRVCTSTEGHCRPLTWELRSRYVVNDFTESELIIWAQRKNWVGNLWRGKPMKNGSFVDYIIPKEGDRFIEEVVSKETHNARQAAARKQRTRPSPRTRPATTRPQVVKKDP